MSSTTPAPLTVATLPVLAHQGLRVITTDLLAQIYGTDAKNIRMNFANNAERFDPGKHYWKLTGEALSTFKHRANDIGSVKISNNVNALMLWTERGAARHAKLLDTEQAWEVFEALEDAYFHPREQAQAAAPAGLTLAQFEAERRRLEAAQARLLAAPVILTHDEYLSLREGRTPAQSARRPNLSAAERRKAVDLINVGLSKAAVARQIGCSVRSIDRALERATAGGAA